MARLRDWGGDVMMVEISALEKTGLDKLCEAVLLQAEMLELKARVDGPAHAVVLESKQVKIDQDLLE